MKNGMKRILSGLLIMVMVLGMSVTSFAAEDTDGKDSQPVLRGPAKPITNISLEDWDWNESERCFDFVIREDGIGPYTVKFNSTQLMAYNREPILGADRTVIGWYIYFKSPRIYNVGTYKMVASFYSSNGTQKVWTLKKDFVVTEDMLP